MAGRWRSQQRRKRWAEHAVFLPEGTLQSLEVWPALQPFASQLATFGNQPSIHAQVSLVKNLGNNLLALIQKEEKGEELSQQDEIKEEELVRVALRVYVELLFVEHSRPLQRGLLSTLSHVPLLHIVPLQKAFMECCQEYGSPGSAKLRRFAVVAVSASLAQLPQSGVLKEVAHFCAPFMSNSLCLDVQSVLQHALEGGRPTPTDMEECQDALSSIYYLLQQFPDKFCDPTQLNGDQTNCDSVGFTNAQSPGSVEGKSSSLQTGGGRPYGAIVCCLLDVLQTAVLSRDCLVAAGVGLAAAAQLASSQEGLALMLTTAAFPSTLHSYKVVSPDEGLTDATSKRGILELAIISHRKSSLGEEVKKLADFGRLCFFRGILTAVPRNVQNVHLLRITQDFKNWSESEVASQQQENVGGKEPQRQEVWTLLYDGILPALCNFCESSVDSHFKFHAFTAMQICLQQIKTSICGHLTHSAFKTFKQSLIRHNIPVFPYDPLPVVRTSQVLQLIWNNWEDPLTQTVKQVQVVFDLFIDVQLVHKRDRYGELSVVEKDNLNSSNDTTESKNVDDVGSDIFLRQIAADLLAAGRYRKGKYVPLASLVMRIGARNMLLMSPDLLFHTIDAFSDDDVCSSASTFLKTFLERLKEDCWSAEGVNEGNKVARRYWIPPLLSGLLTGDGRLRNNLTTYALPVAMQIDCDSLSLVLAYILDGHGKDGGTTSSLSWEELEGALGLPGLLTVEQQVILLISVLKVARSLGLVDGSIEQKLSAAHEGDFEYDSEFKDKPSLIGSSLLVSHAVLYIKDQPVEFPVSLLLMALTHKEDGLRVDAAELVCLSPKTASMPSPFELCLLRISLPLNMRCSSTAFRMRWTSFLKKFFLRVRTAVERQSKADNLRSSQLKQTQVLSSGNGGAVDQQGSRNLGSSISDNKSAVTVDQMEEFMHWLSQMLISSLYPSAPYERKTMAMEIFNALIEVWSLKLFWQKRVGRYTSSPYLDTVKFSPYHPVLFSVDFTLVVVGALVDSWDRLREGAYRILIQYPTPLPGLDSESNVEGLLKWAKDMVNSPRVRESDAGALAFRLIFRKYVVDLGWSVKVHVDPKVVIRTAAEAGAGEVTVEYLQSLNDWLQWGIEEGEKDLLKACTHSFVHGVLLVLRYTVEEIDWTSSAMQLCSEKLRDVLKRLLSLLLRVTSLALWVVSADALTLQIKRDGSSLTAGEIPENDSFEFEFTAANGGAGNDGYFEECLAPAEQMVMVGCWLSVKEVSLLLGTIARYVPLPGSPSMSKADRGDIGTPVSRPSPDMTKPSPMLDGKQLEAIGSHFVQVLLSMKHNGAIDKTRTGFIALSDRLLRSSDPWLNKLPEIWLQQLMDHAGAKGQVVDDLLRRSAGIPPAFLALFLAEPDGSPKKLLPMGMRWLLDTCKGFLIKSQSQNTKTTSEVEQDLVPQIKHVLPVHSIPEGLSGMREDGTPVALKSRDEGVVPTVHAFNVLRMAFHDTMLATDTSGFCAEGLITAIQAFRSSYWEVRNSATLAFTALVHRTIGFLNVFKRESARRAITGFEFFHRYPTLHPFLLQELQEATWQLEHGAGAGSGMGSLLHPSLGPVLIILSRLKPSFINSDVEDWLNPSAFIPYVSQCATQRNLHMRVLASKALAPLVSAKDLPTVILQLAQSLPLSASVTGGELIIVEDKLVFNAANSGTNGSHMTGIYQACSFNAIHGILLQMCTLLSSNCTSLFDIDQRCKLVSQVSQAVKERLWLGSIRFCSCYMVTGSFLDMLVGLLSLAQLCEEKLSNPELINHLQVLLGVLSCECLDDCTEDLNWQDSTKVGLREKAARLYFQTMLSRGSFQDKDAGMVPRLSGDITDKSGVQVVGQVGSCYSSSQSYEQFVRRLKQALVDRTYEVRLATLKVLKKHCGLRWAEQEKSISGQHFQSDKITRAWNFLRPVIIERLRVETHSPCIRRILQVTYSWTLIDSRDRVTHVTIQEGQTRMALDTDSVWGSGLSSHDLWSSLLKIYKTSKEMKTKEAAVRCLGGSLRHMLVGIIDFMKSSDLTNKGPQLNCSSNAIVATNMSGFKASVDTWLDIAKVHSVASEAVNFRRATSEAIVASGMLEHANWIGHKLMEDSQRLGGSNNSLESTDREWYARAILSSWCICIKLLEDEDLDLRQKLALSLQKVVTRADAQKSDVVAAQVEKVIQVTFDYLSSQFGQWREYYAILAEWVLGSEDSTDFAGGDVNLVRHLFDKEIDNHHGEELLFVQLCCLHLEKFVKQSGKAAALSTWYGPFLCKWRMKYLERATLCAQLSMQINDRVQWVGGVTNHEEIFRSLYRSLLGLLTFAGPWMEGKGSETGTDSHEEEFVRGLAKVSDLLRQLPLNPLVSNTLVQVLQAYEEQLKVRLGSSEIRAALKLAFSASFSPLFLIS
ncbi:unnamed protein product [Calypogeia fissa]